MPQLDGERFVRPGFARDPADDLAFACGYPHQHTWTDEPPPPVTPADARKLLAKRAHHLISPDDLPAVQLLEAQAGPAVVAEAIVEVLEKFKDADFQAWNRGAIQLMRWGLGFALLRSPATVGAALRARLAAVYARAAKAPNGNKPRQVQQMLDVVLHGAAGAERSGQRHEGAVQTFDLLFVHDDPGFVLDQVQRHKLDISWRPSARLAFLGGEPVVAHYAEHCRKIRDRAEVHAFIRDFGKMSSPAAARAVAELSTAWAL